MSHSNFDHRHYVIISPSSAETLRFSVDGTLTFVKYEGDMPSSVTACSSKSQEYSHDEILAILNNADQVWWEPMEEMP